MAIVPNTAKDWIRTAGASYFDFLTNSDYSAPVYEATVYREDNIKSISISPKIIEKIINGSGAIRDRLILKKGVDIGISANLISSTVMNKAEGVTAEDGFVVYKTTTEGTAFAYGTVFKRRDGSYTYFWWPLCRMQPPEMGAETETDAEIPDPEVAHTINAMALDNEVWCVKYNTADASGTPLTEAAFFAAPYTDDSEVADQTNFMNIIPVAELPTIGIDATAVYVLTADDGLKLEGTMWRYLSSAWVEYEVA